MPLLPKLSNIFKARKDRADETQSLYEEFLPGRIHQSIVLENNNNNNNAPPIPHRRTSQLIDALDLALPVEGKVEDQISKKGLFRRFIGRLIPRRFKAKKRLDLADPAKMLKTCLHYHQVKEAYPGSFSHIFVIRKTKRGQKLICKVGKFGPDSRKFSVFGDSYDEYIRESNAFELLKPHPNIVKYDSTAQVYLPTGSDDSTQAFSIFTNEQLPDTLLMSVTVIEKLEMSLTEWMDTNQMAVLSEDLTKAIFEQIGGALRHCHAEHFLCHKDLKSDNIAVVRNFGLKRLPQLKLIDFGVAHIYTAELYTQAREQASNFLLANTNEQDAGTSNFVCLKKSNNAFLTESFKFANMLVRLSHARTNDQISDKTFKSILFTMAPIAGVEQVTIEWALENFGANN